MFQLMILLIPMLFAIFSLWMFWDMTNNDFRR
jgi:hypothetical protein